MKKHFNILLTGATGFVGNHLAQKLIDQGHRVFILVRSLEKLNQFPIPKAVLIYGSLSPHKNLWAMEFKEKLAEYNCEHPDIVVHSAGIVHSIKSKYFYRDNTKVTQVLWNDLQETFPQRSFHFLYLSSLAATGPSLLQRPVNENSKNFPVSHYGRSKKEAENFLKKHSSPLNPVTIIRPPMILGPKDVAFLDLFKMVKSGVNFIAGLDGLKKEYSFISVFDLTNALVCILERPVPTPHQVYFIAHPNTVTLEKLLKVIQNSLKKSWVINIRIPSIFLKIIAQFLKFIHPVIRHNIRLTPDKVREMLPYSWCASSEKFQSEFQFQWDYDLEKTVDVTARDYQSRNWL